MITGDLTYVKVTDVDELKCHDIYIDVRPFISIVDDGFCYCGTVILDRETFNGYFTKRMFSQFGFVFI